MNKEQLKEIKAEPIVETHSMYNSPKYITKDHIWFPMGYNYLRYFAAIHSKPKGYYATIHSDTNTESLQDKQNQIECDSKSDIKKLVLHKK